MVEDKVFGQLIAAVESTPRDVRTAALGDKAGRAGGASLHRVIEYLGHAQLAGRGGLQPARTNRAHAVEVA